MAASASSPDGVNQYAGFQLPSTSAPYALDAVPADKVGSEEFWTKYIVQRKPCKIVGVLPGWKGHKWTNQYLAAQAGQCTVEVESRDGAGGRFGLGNVGPMNYGEFLGKLDAGDTSLYLTTQPLEEDKDGPVVMASAPVTHLVDDFPPSPCPPLVMDQWNVWQGCTKEGSTSGLHHDTHDNIYVLVRGRKRFRLFSPADALHMRTSGTITQVHPNGVINYSQPTRADGAHVASVAEWACASAEAELEAAAAELEGLDPSAPPDAVAAAEARSAAAETAMEEAMDAMLDLAGGGSDSEGEEGGLSFAEGEGDGDEEEASAALASLFGSAAPATQHRAGGALLADDYDDDTEEVQAAKAQGAAAKAAAARTSLPQNFSSLDLTRPWAELTGDHPSLAACPMAEVEVGPGEMLYLPAGWFHEVTSYGSDAGGHMAFNYWMHPPVSSTWSAPYPDAYWSQRYEARKPAAPAGGGKKARVE